MLTWASHGYRLLSLCASSYYGRRNHQSASTVPLCLRAQLGDVQDPVASGRWRVEIDALLVVAIVDEHSTFGLSSLSILQTAMVRSRAV